MSMNRNEKYQADQAYKRSQDIPVGRSTAKTIETLACAHLAEGDAGMFKLAMSSLAKMQQTSNDSVLLQAIAKKMLIDVEEPEDPG